MNQYQTTGNGVLPNTPFANRPFLIRECQQQDYIRIYELNRDSLGYDYPLEKTRLRLAQVLSLESNKIYVAVLDGIVVGYIHGADYDCVYSDSLKNILGIAVDPACQKLGIGKALLNTAEMWAKESGCAGVRLVSGEKRSGAHEFYRHCGYIEQKNQKNFIKKMGTHTESGLSDPKGESV